MREIKFRAWNKEWGEMVYSSVLNHHEKREWYPIGFAVGFSHYPHDIDNTEIMQFTGRKGNNGKDIYEGDIVKACDELQGFIMRVYWCDLDLMWRVGYMNGLKKVDDKFCMYNNLEVIGNIHENPELLENQ